MAEYCRLVVVFSFCGNIEKVINVLPEIIRGSALRPSHFHNHTSTELGGRVGTLDRIRCVGINPVDFFTTGFQIGSVVHCRCSCRQLSYCEGIRAFSYQVVAMVSSVPGQQFRAIGHVSRRTPRRFEEQNSRQIAVHDD